MFGALQFADDLVYAGVLLSPALEYLFARCKVGTGGFELCVSAWYIVIREVMIWIAAGHDREDCITEGENVR